MNCCSCILFDYIFWGWFILLFSKERKKYNVLYGWLYGTLLRNNKIVEFIWLLYLCEYGWMCVCVWFFFHESHSSYYLRSHCWNVWLFHFSPCQPYRRNKVISTALCETVFRWFSFLFVYMISDFVVYVCTVTTRSP